MMNWTVTFGFCFLFTSLSFAQSDDYRLPFFVNAKEIAISGPSYQKLSKFFSKRIDLEANAPEDIQNIIVENTPAELRHGCLMLFSHGDEEKAKKNNRNFDIRLLSKNEKSNAKFRYIIFAYRCWYDEKLGILALNSNRAFLSIIEPKEGDFSLTNVTRFGVGQSLIFPGGEGVAIEQLNSDQHPCCGGPCSYNETRVHFLQFYKKGARIIGSIVRSRVSACHSDDPDDEGKDFGNQYLSVFKFNTDPSGEIKKINVSYTSEKEGKLLDKGDTSLTWKPSATRFEWAEGDPEDKDKW